MPVQLSVFLPEFIQLSTHAASGMLFVLTTWLILLEAGRKW